MAKLERKSAKTALITKAKWRNCVEMALENRLERYDINVDLLAPIVPLCLRKAVRQRINDEGKVLVPLDGENVSAIIPLAQV